MSTEAKAEAPKGAAPAKAAPIIGSSGKEVCRAFRNTGSCRFAADCKYEHSEGDPIEPPPRDYTPRGDCHNWTETKECRFGERCRFLHGETDKRTTYRPERKKEESAAAATGEKQICRIFQRRGKCRFGDKCLHLHVEKKESPKTEKKAAPKAEKKEAKKEAKKESKKESKKEAKTEGAATATDAGEKKKRRRRRSKAPKKSDIVLTEDNKFDSQGVELCRNFRNNGKCRFADTCHYSHEPGPAIGQPAGAAAASRPAAAAAGAAAGGAARAPREPGLCYNFRDEGACSFGDECRYKHGDADSRDFSAKRAPRKSTGVCYQFQEKGSCEYGAECRFSHDATATASA